jgi:hypothetical protein
VVVVLVFLPPAPFGVFGALDVVVVVVFAGWTFGVVAGPPLPGLASTGAPASVNTIVLNPSHRVGVRMVILPIGETHRKRRTANEQNCDRLIARESVSCAVRSSFVAAPAIRIEIA